MRPATSLARWLLAVCAETPARAASSPAGLASPPARARQIMARVLSARRPATNAILASISEPSIAPSGAWMFHGRSNPNVGAAGLVYRVQKPAGSQARTVSSSAEVGVDVSRQPAATRRSHPVAALTASTL